MVARGWAGCGSLVGRGKISDSVRRLAGVVGPAETSEMTWAHVELAVPRRQRRGENGCGPKAIMRCPHEAERGRDRAGRKAVG